MRSLDDHHDQAESRVDTLRDSIASELARWGFFLCGLVLLAAGALIPIRDDMVSMRHLRDTAHMVETLHTQRIERYTQTLDAIEKKDPETMARLVHANLGMIPSDRMSLVSHDGGSLTPRDPMLFALLEPAPITPPELPLERSRLERIMLDDSARLWAIALGAFLVLLGLLPRSANNPA